jgi:pimeloyl-ACP methyl ester carboxylesterase
MGAAFDEGHVTTIDGLRLFFRDYNAAPPGPTPVLCLPGLTRNHRDFGPLAEILSERRRVICPDMRGRGNSDRDPLPENYNPVTETGDVLRLIERLALPPCVVIGTSRGGICAMLIAAMKPEFLAGAVLNDIGPKIEKRGLLRIVATLSMAPDSFPSWDAAAASLKRANAAFFPTLSDNEWRAFAHRLHAEIDGKPARDYDWKLARATETAVSDEPPQLWSQFEALAKKPLLTIRGGLSDILSAETLAEMARRAPAMRAVTLPDRGHTPILDEPECVAAIEALLQEVDTP